MADSVVSQEVQKQISVKVPLRVWQFYRMLGIQEGVTMQAVVEKALVEWMAGGEALSAMVRMGPEAAAAFSPSARGEDVDTGIPAGVCAVVVKGSVDPGGNLDGRIQVHCAEPLNPDRSCPVHGYIAENMRGEPGVLLCPWPGGCGLEAAHVAGDQYACPTHGIIRYVGPGSRAEMIDQIATEIATPNQLLEEAEAALLAELESTPPTVAEAEQSARSKAVAELAARKKAATAAPPKRAGVTPIPKDGAK